jgi:hypothetical protein
MTFRLWEDHPGPAIPVTLDNPLYEIIYNIVCDKPLKLNGTTYYIKGTLTLRLVEVL